MAIFRPGPPGVTPLARRHPNGTQQTARSDDGEQPVCQLCLRESQRFTVHHLVPRSQGGKFGPKAKLCPTCHRQLHALFSESTLAKEMDSLERIRVNPEMVSYLEWVRKQKGQATFRVRQANHPWS